MKWHTTINIDQTIEAEDEDEAKEKAKDNLYQSMEQSLDVLEEFEVYAIPIEELKWSTKNSFGDAFIVVLKRMGLLHPYLRMIEGVLRLLD